ncbi:MAG: aminotransferase, partial [Firmicutes bacterium]|nr:aminotransferase [Bacillota bacterium]
MKDQFNEILLPDRTGTNSRKWDNLAEHFERGDLLPMWIADMDFKAPQCVRQALHEYVDQGAFGYYRTPDAYYENFIRWEESHHGYRVRREW